MKKLLVLVVVLVAFALASVAQAGKFGNSGATVSGPLDPTTLTPVSPVYGDTVVFDVEGVTADQSPWLRVNCYQDNDRVFYAIQPYLGGSGLTGDVTLADQGATLMTVPWPTDTAASCTVNLSVLNGKNHKIVASADFNVGA